MADPPQKRVQTAAHYQPLVIVLAAVGSGILLDRYQPLTLGAWWLGGLTVFCVWFVFWCVGWHRIAAICLLAALVALGGAWHHLRWSVFRHDDLGRFVDDRPRPICLDAIALGRPRRLTAPPTNPLRTVPQGDQSRISMRLVALRDGDDWRPVSGTATLTAQGHVLGVQAGDRLRVLALASAPHPPRNPGEFDFAGFLRTRRELSQLAAAHPACVQVTGHGSKWTARRQLDEIRFACTEILGQNVSERRATLAATVLLGAREQLDPERADDFFVTGTVHLLAISGLHVGILVYAFWLLARTTLLPRHWTLLAAVAFVCGYALLTDARPPVLRAAVLVTALCVARLLGRQAFSFNTLAAAALVVLALSPAQLFQTGTQLSFLAVATLASCRPLFVRRVPADPLTRLIANTRPWYVRAAKRIYGGVWRLTATSLVIWLAALPLVIYRFHLVTPIAVLVNPLLMLPVAVALFAGFASLVFGWLVPPLGAASGWLCDVSLQAIELLIQLARQSPAGHFFTPGPALWWVVGFYAGWGVLIAVPRLRPPRRWLTALIAVWLAVGWGTSPPLQRALDRDRRAQLDCTFLAVGHGTSVLVELPDGRAMLYDAGRLGSPTAGMRIVTGAIWSRGITHLDAVVISHADADHYNIVPELLERVSVGVVYVSPVMFEDESTAVQGLRGAIESAGVPIRYLSGGQRLDGGQDVDIEVLHPPPHGVVGSDNANSIVLRIDFAGRRILLPGDLESPGLEDVLAELPTDFDVVMAPHHGSPRSNSSGFAIWSTPEWVVISGGQGDDTSIVKAAYEKAGAKVLHTAEAGAVRVTLDEVGVHVQHWNATEFVTE